MSRRRLSTRALILGGLATLLLIVAATALWPPGPGLELGPEQFERLRQGMTRSEVEHVLGLPAEGKKTVPGRRRWCIT